MSWEGYLQCLCRNGHQFALNGLYSWDDSIEPSEDGWFSLSLVPRCPFCGEYLYWQSIIDCTNGEQDEVSFPVTIKSHKCECCGTFTPVVYDISKLPVNDYNDGVHLEIDEEHQLARWVKNSSSNH